MTLKEARRTLEWVEEHLECVGGPFKEVYIAGLKAVDELLEKQEPAIPKTKVRHGEYPEIVHRCRECKAVIDRYNKYCWNCGRAVNWNIFTDSAMMKKNRRTDP